jgi:drug/metabolite transporter (DMT)-like permease
MNPTTIGLLLGLGAAVAWTGANLTIRAAADRLGSFGSLLAAQITGVGPIILLAVFLEGAPGGLPTLNACMLLAVAGLAACLAFGGLFNAFRLGSVSVVGPLISAWSVVSVGVSYFFMGQIPSAMALMGVGCVGIGNAILARFSMGDTSERESARVVVPRIAIIAACVSAVGFGVMMPAMNVVAKDMGQLWTIPTVWAVQWVFLLPLLRILGQRVKFPRSLNDWRIAVVPGLFEAAGFASLTIGLGFAPMAVVAPTSSLSTGLTVVAGFCFLHERLHPASVFGAAIVAIGVVMVGIS